MGDVFKQNESMGVYAEFYNLGVDEKTKRPQGVLEYEVLNNADNRTVLTQTDDLAGIEHGSAFLVAVRKKLSLKTLPPGRYTLRLKMEDAVKRQTLTPSVQFTVTL